MVKIKRDNNISRQTHYNVTDIYEILYSIDADSLRKIARCKADELGDEIKARISEVKKIAKELSWDQTALSKGIDFVLKNLD